ncbi:response regulator transcription factor [Paenibacillus sp. SYP-B4298]|uniref:response regulator transcription factor n=1 Tax=Paenibacillus sp. SYP-B4298 TaxID=2996034 RepID=UPI0022DD72ED|nr:response regulator [Paenibacillus sp. SYP-B4298]
MRALIVDDEARVRRAIRLLVDWEVHGIEAVGEASSGQEAIELIRRDKPELVIMDMMMSEGNGLELMSWIGDEAATPKLIVVSGHHDFEFVRAAVRHGGIDYILKPIEPEAIHAAVAKAVGQWREEERERQSSRQQTIRLNEFKPIYDEKLLSSLIDDPATEKYSLRRLHSEGVIPQQAASARLLLLQTDPADTELLQRFGGNSELLHFALVNICNEFLTPCGRGIAFKYWGSPGEIILLVWEHLDSMQQLVDAINDGLEHTLQRRMHMGMGVAGALPCSLPQQYHEAVVALRRRNLLQPDRYAHDITAAEPAGALNERALEPLQDGWRMAVLSGNHGEIEVAMRRWTDMLGREEAVTPEWLQFWQASVHSFCERLLREKLGGEAETVRAELERQGWLGSAPSVGGASFSFSIYGWGDWLRAALTGLSRAILEHQARESSAINDIVAYIDKHYMDNLSLQQLAAAFHLSREYISRKFKQEFGHNFSDYLSAYRIGKAKQLLLNPYLKLAQIAEMVGFSDVKYFSKVFKKQEGRSPREYRQQQESRG